jgi:hypothetical protein
MVQRTSQANIAALQQYVLWVQVAAFLDKNV